MDVAMQYRYCAAMCQQIYTIFSIAEFYIKNLSQGVELAELKLINYF